MENLIEANRDMLEKAYYGFFGENVLSQDEKQREAFQALEMALVNLGILEAEEENESDHYDEWVADQRHEARRDYALAMGYER